MTKKTSLFPSGLALTCALLCAGAAAQTSDTLKLGMATSKTGPWVSLANTNEISAQIAVDEINAKGGVNGRKLSLSVFDTAGDPKQAALAVRRFVDEDALAIVGPFSSSEVRVAFPAGERAGIAQMSMSSSAPGLAKGFSYGFRNTVDEGRVIVQVMAALADKKLPMQTAAIAYATDDTVSKSVGTNVLPPVFKQANLPVKATVDFQHKAFDLSSQVSQLAAVKPDILGLGAPPEGAVNLAKELRRQGVQTRMVGGTTFADPDLPMRMDGAGETTTIGTTFYSDYNDVTRAFAAEFAKRARAAGIERTEPNQMDASSYDIVYLYAEAMRQANVTGAKNALTKERTAIRDALVSTAQFDVLEGPIYFDKDHDAIKPIYVLETRNRQWTLMDRRLPKE